ncbi:metalloregulator ArsR/SmtB family transcription factor [Alicyclobacillus sp.]|uniref:ArsR/SmtB family transcription factor n=1 Tax=Alicyclobacillus sp. TaxID=61169 RepID=UPI0025BCBDE8|nr:metalloregulator ArsR/SmtB family transcription factor [Alicyclobacillus sp.]MCL6515309.1 metalloregulator ArsR/SmtB family transcription factor [Alicyclobacillus sp.]
MDTETLLVRLQALADRSRLTMLQMLANGSIATCCDRIEAYERGCCVADVVTATGLSQPTVSHHLKVLEKAGLVRKEVRGPWTCYFPNPDGMNELLNTLNAYLSPVAQCAVPPEGCCNGSTPAGR